MLSIEIRILYRIRGKGRGWAFSPRLFLDFGSRKAVDLALHKLTNRGDIRRLGRGIYDYPKSNPNLGVLNPSIEAIAKLIASKNNSQLKITGAEAANALGLTTQVPARVVYLTDGASRKVKIGKQTIEFKHTSPRNMAAAGKASGIVIQALNYIGKDRIDEEIVETIKNKLSDFDKKALKKDVDFCPDWMRPFVTKIVS